MGQPCFPDRLKRKLFNAVIKKENKTAHQKPSTVNPFKTPSAKKMIMAFITNKKRPKVIMVKGIVIITNKGLRVEFRMANTMATQKASHAEAT